MGPSHDPRDIQDLNELALQQRDYGHPLSEGNAAACERMREANIPAPVIANFSRMYHAVEHGSTGIISEEDISPVRKIRSLSEISCLPKYHAAGVREVGSLAVIRLNGGLGTGMGLSQAKSLITVKNGLTFNGLIAKQIEKLNETLSISIPLVHMTSPSTHDDVVKASEEFPGLAIPGLSPVFCQHKHPKIYKDSLLPVELTGTNGEDLEISWNPPGHGDIYAALLSSGIADELLKRGKKYLFVANADNLGATFDSTILGYMKLHGIPFLMETAQRTDADRKGGHLAVCNKTGRLMLRESAQAPLVDGKIIPAFEDITRYTDFNTNNIWLDLEAVVRVASSHGGCVPLQVIRNEKPVDPTDRTSRRVYQLETAMGAAISVFEGAEAIRVPRARFAPVKSHSDLLLVMSDVYRLNERCELTRSGNGLHLPKVALDTAHYDMHASFKQLMVQVPSLLHATSLKVMGPVIFEHNIKIVGDVTIVNRTAAPLAIPRDVTTLHNQTFELG